MVQPAAHREFDPSGLPLLSGEGEDEVKVELTSAFLTLFKSDLLLASLVW